MREVLLYGGSGLVGSRFLELQSQNFNIKAPTHTKVDLTNYSILKDHFLNSKPELVLYAVGQTNVDKAEQELMGITFALNTGAVFWLVELCKQQQIPFYYLSTDYVFDGTQMGRSYKEEDAQNPLGLYALSKAEGEDITLEASDRNGVIRLIMPFSAHFDKKLDLARLTLDKLRKGEKLQGIKDQKVNPIFVDHLVSAIAVILDKQSSGIYHLGATSYVSAYDYMQEIARQFGLDANLIEPIDFVNYNQTRPAKRAQNSWLDTTKFRSEFGEGILHSFEEGIAEFKIQIDSKL